MDNCRQTTPFYFRLILYAYVTAKEIISAGKIVKMHIFLELQLLRLSSSEIYNVPCNLKKCNKMHFIS